MPIYGFLFYALSIGIFSWFLFKIGKTMFQLDSVQKSMDRYVKSPAQSSWIEKYFFGWAFFGQMAMTKAMVNGMGDGTVTGFYKFAGVIFMIFAICFALSVPLMAILPMIVSPSV